MILTNHIKYLNRKIIIHTIVARIVVLTFSLSLAYSNTGKVSGKVTDSITGNPLAGVNVFLDNTPYGAATDEFGEYIILNVPPGDYTLRATYIGYASYRVQNMRVSLDRTTQRNIRNERGCH